MDFPVEKDILFTLFYWLRDFPVRVSTTLASTLDNQIFKKGKLKMHIFNKSI